MSRRIVVVLHLACFAAAGCSTLAPQDPSPQAPPSRQPPAGEAPGREAPAREAPARQAPRDETRGGSAEPAPPAGAGAVLLRQSRDQRDAGDFSSAAASIERALRIEPNNAALWVELGEIRLAEGDPAQAEMMARKALTLAPGSAVQARANRLIDR